MNIYLDTNATSFSFYNSLLPNLSAYYREYPGRESLPTISFENVEWLDPLIIPNIIGAGIVLKKYHRRPIPLKLVWNPRLLYFLNEIGFFQVIDNPILQIYDYNKDYVGGFPSDKKYRDKHKLHYYFPDMNYYKIPTNQQATYRNNMFEQLRYNHIPNDYREVIGDQGALTSTEINRALNVLTEIICNSVLYSESECFSFIQTNAYGTSLSISDCGIGFKGSFDKKKIDLPLYRELKEKVSSRINRDASDFLIILDVLDYSKRQERENLWDLKNLVIKNHGKLRIHYNSTQLVFTHNRCSGCSKEIKECMECHLSTKDWDPQYASLRFFSSKYSGVHIEVELNRREG